MRSDNAHELALEVMRLKQKHKKRIRLAFTPNTKPARPGRKRKARADTATNEDLAWGCEVASELASNEVLKEYLLEAAKRLRRKRKSRET